jgi:hypothetical protein
MKKIIIFLSIIFCLLGCKKEIKVENTQLYQNLSEDYDSILKLHNEFVSSPFYKFHSIYKSEKGDVLDTTLISKYNEIVTNDDVLKVYIDSRIETISNNYSFNEVMNIYEGIYFLKKDNSRTKNVDFTSIEIKNDSCFLYKNKDLVIASNIRLINSNGGLTKGLFYIKNKYLLNLHADQLIQVKDTKCLHCESFYFIKRN